LADGVPVDKLYPIDIPRAARKVKELAPNVVWYSDAAQAGQFLVSREGVMAMGGDGRFKTLARSRAPIRVAWNQGRFTFDVWYVLRGAKNRDSAMRFIAFASRPEPQAQLAKLSGYGPVNPLAFQHLDEETARDLPTYPQNLRQMFVRDDGWWQQNRQQWFEACRAAVLG